MVSEYEINTINANNYDDIIIYFRDTRRGVTVGRWIITNSDADTFRRGDLIITYTGNISREALQNICQAFPNDFYLGTSYADEDGEDVQVNHIRFKPSPKTSNRNLSDWLHTSTTAPVVCGNCKNLDKCAGGDIERATMLDRDASQCVDFE